MENPQEMSLEELNAALANECIDYIARLLDNLVSLQIAVKQRYLNPNYYEQGFEFADTAALQFIEERTTKLLDARPIGLTDDADEPVTPVALLEQLVKTKADNEAAAAYEYARIDAILAAENAIMDPEARHEAKLERFAERAEERFDALKLYIAKSNKRRAKAEYELAKEQYAN